MFFTLLAVFAHARAGEEAVLFSQLNIDGGYSAGSGWNITGGTAYLRDTFVGYHSTASFFSLTSGATLGSIDIALSYEQDSAVSDVYLELQSSSPSVDLPDGTIIASGTVTVSTPFNSDSIGLVSFRPSQSVFLQANKTYWIVAKPIMPESYVIWNSFPASPFWLRERLAGSYDGTTYLERWSNDVPAFRVTGVAIPEPSAFGTMTGLFVILHTSLKRRQK